MKHTVTIEWNPETREWNFSGSCDNPFVTLYMLGMATEKVAEQCMTPQRVVPAATKEQVEAIRAALTRG